MNGCTFDNNLPCIAEKEIVAVDSVADELMNYMISENGCYLASKEIQDKLVQTVFTPKGALNRKCVGRSAQTLLAMVGVNVGPEIRCIVFEGQKEHPLIAEELMMPILGMVRVKSFEEGVETAVWLEHGNRHSAHIHSKIRWRRLLYIYNCFQNRRRFNSCTQLYKEQTLYNVRQPLHQIREGENKNGSKRAGC